MSHLAKLIFYLLKELIFDNKDEYDFKSRHFNARKFIILIIISLSFVINAWLISRLYYVATELIECRTENHIVLIDPPEPPEPPEMILAKKPPRGSSDSGRRHDSSPTYSP